MPRIGSGNLSQQIACARGDQDSVLASMVRKLAERTRSATDQINALGITMIEATSRSVERIGEVSSQVHQRKPSLPLSAPRRVMRAAGRASVRLRSRFAALSD